MLFRCVLLPWHSEVCRLRSYFAGGRLYDISKVWLSPKWLLFPITSKTKHVDRNVWMSSKEVEYILLCLIFRFDGCAEIYETWDYSVCAFALILCHVMSQPVVTMFPKKWLACSSDGMQTSSVIVDSASAEIHHFWNFALLCIVKRRGEFCCCKATNNFDSSKYFQRNLPF